MHDDALLNFLPESDISDALIEQARVTRFPSPISTTSKNLTSEQKIDLIADRFRDIMEILGLDLGDQSLQNTPYRVAKMYVEEVFTGLDPQSFPQVSIFEDCYQHSQRSNMVFVKIHFSSFCEHHFVPMQGIANIAYLPNGKLIGLATIPRIVRFFSRQPQVQERLAAQIADSLSTLMQTDHVAVSLSAEHHCMTVRGIESTNSHVVTNVLRGNFEMNPQLQQEFFHNMAIGKP